MGAEMAWAWDEGGDENGMGMRKTICRNGPREVDSCVRRNRSCFTNSLQPESGWFNLAKEHSSTQRGKEQSPSPRHPWLLRFPDYPWDNTMGQIMPRAPGDCPPAV